MECSGVTMIAFFCNDTLFFSNGPTAVATYVKFIVSVNLIADLTFFLAEKVVPASHCSSAVEALHKQV